ncbi:hypothetical protein ACI782_12710 [Geodermatophilus sp. SYSU D00703]
MRGVDGRRGPRREELLPIAAEQSCIICGSRNWRFVHLLVQAPQWVQALPWDADWFVALCDPCHERHESGDDAGWAAAHERQDRGTSEPPLYREGVQRTP